MTKIKNTKKGMAKKTLSISLAVAMLATSNVPVWAAEFTDGSEAVFTSEAPAEVVEEAPVVEDAEAPVAEASNDLSSLVYDDTDLAKFRTGEWGTAIGAEANNKLPSIHYTDGATEVTGTVNAYWTYKGNQVGDASTVTATNKEDLAGALSGMTKGKFAYVPTKAQCLEGGDFGMVVRIYVNGEINFSKTYNFGPAKKIDLTDELKTGEEYMLGRVNFPDTVYNGKEQKPAAEYVDGFKNPTAEKEIMWGPQSQAGKAPEENIYIKDFAYDYVRTINGKNDLVSADRRLDNEKVDVLMKVTKPGYEGSYLYKDAFAINQRKLVDEELDIKFTKPTYEFTGADIQPAVSDLTAVNTATGDDLTSFIASVTELTDDEWTDKGDETSTATIKFKYDTANDPLAHSIMRNYSMPGTNGTKDTFNPDNTVKIVPRDLSKCTVELDGDYSKGELDNMIRTGTPFTWDQLKLYDAEGHQLKEQKLLDRVVNKVSKENDKYYITVTPARFSDGKVTVEVINSKKTEVGTPAASLRRAKVYFEAAKTPADHTEEREFSKVLKNGIEYTGEAYKVTKDDIYVMDWAKSQGNEAVTDTLYDIECDPTFNVGRHWVKIIGKGDYAGSTLTVWYNVTPASYKEHKLNKEVVYNDSYETAAEYAKAIGLDVTAFNEAMEENAATKKVDATTSKDFKLTADDMTVKYEFVESGDANGIQNKLHNHIKVTATITNPNYLDTENVKKPLPTGVTAADGKVVITETVEIVHPSIADAKVEILGDYTFTGKKIIPEVKVTAYDGTVLKEGEDYRLDVKHGEHATDKAEVVITATRTCDDDTDYSVAAKAHYEEGTVNEGNFFTIKPAKLSDLEVTGKFEYKGEAWTPSIDELGLKLGDVILTGNKKDPEVLADFFEPTMPKYFSNNVNAGTASFTLFVKDAWKGDFVPDTAEIPFQIAPKALTEENLDKGVFTVYAANGHILNFTAFEGFTYDGEAKTFKDAKYDSEEITLGNNTKYTLVKDKDYTIEYAANINPDVTGKDGKTSYIYVKLSPNFTITPDATAAKYSITLQDGTVISNVAAQNNFRIVKASVENAAVSVTNPVYNMGEEVKPAVTVSVDGKELVEGKDYELVYDENETFGATVEDSKLVTIKGINGYVGTSKVAKWGIDKKDINGEDIKVTLDKKSYKPNEEPQVIAVVVGDTIVDASEYTVAYTDKENGILTITAAGKNFAGEKVVEYTVAARADLADATVYGIKESYEVTGEAITAENLVVTINNKFLTEGEDYTVTYENNVEVGTATVTIKAVEGSADYKGEKVVTFEITEVKPEVGQAMIEDVIVNQNRATVVLSGDVDGAEGYDYVIATEEDYKNGRVDIVKNQLKKEGNFFYVQEGTYYAYCHAYKRDEVTGKKVFGEWSNLFKFEVASTTPDTPEITDVKVEGSTVTVTYKKAANAIGYDMVLGTEYKKVNGEYRPVAYGELVKKSQTKTTVVFKNVPAGNYYVGMHGYNRTPNNGLKVFSRWENWGTRITVK